MKPNPRVLGIDDGYFKPRSKGKCLIVGVLASKNRVEGIISTHVRIDALDSTQKIIQMIKSSRFKEQASFLILSGLNFAGFNFADVEKLHASLGIPIIIVLRKKPDFKRIERALSRFKDRKKRLLLMEKAGPVFKAENIFFQCFGCEKKEAESILKRFSLNSNLPEPVRLAHLIASGLSLGESTKP